MYSKWSACPGEREQDTDFTPIPNEDLWYSDDDADVTEAGLPVMFWRSVVAEYGGDHPTKVLFQIWLANQFNVYELRRYRSISMSIDDYVEIGSEIQLCFRIANDPVNSNLYILTKSLISQNLELHYNTNDGFKLLQGVNDFRLSEELMEYIFNDDEELPVEPALGDTEEIDDGYTSDFSNSE